MREKLPKSAPYATIIPSRVPRLKAHAELADVRRAVAIRLTFDPNSGRMVTSEGIQVYRWEEKGWKLLWSIPALTLEDDLPWKKQA